MKIFFNSSMPRSGSTLLQNILGNNPQIYATPTSGLLDMLVGCKKIYTENPAFRAQNEEEMKSAFLMFCRYGIEGYFRGLTEAPYVIDKSRGWAISWAFLNGFYPEPKIVCMVRDLRDIVASMEKNYRKYPEKWDISQDGEADVTINERVKGWMNKKPVGSTLKYLKDVIHRGYDKKLLFIRFEDLCIDPEKEMRKIYEYLQIPYYRADYQNIKQVTSEDDRFHGRYGDHKIKQAIAPVKSQSTELLGSYICEKLYEHNKWYFDYFNYVK